MEVDIVDIDKCPYVVVQFLQLPYADIGDYSCVPHSWIRIRRGTDRKSKVAYPDESPSRTNIRIINCEKPSKNWNLYMAIIKHEAYSYKDASEFIMGRLRYASTKRYSAIMSTDYKHIPATATRRYSPVPKTTNLSESQSTENKLKRVDTAKLGDTISNSSKLLNHPNVKLTIPTSSELLGSVLPESIMAMEIYGRECQDQITHDVQPHDDDILDRYPHLQRKPETGNGPLTQTPNIQSHIQDPKNNAKHFNQLNISISSPVNEYRPLVSSTQKTPGQSSEVECAISKPSSHGEMVNASYASISGLNLSEYQDPSIAKIIIDEPSEVSCVEQSVLSEGRVENKSSPVPNSLKNVNHLIQSAESSMEKGPPMTDEITSNDVSSIQDVDDDERSNSPEISSGEILTACSNSKDQSIDSVLNKADVLADQLFNVFQQMKVDFSQTCQIVQDLHKSLVQSNEVVECLTNAAKKFRESTKGEIAVSTSKKVTVEVEQMSEGNKAEKKEEENPDVNIKENRKDDNDDDSKASKNDDSDDDDDDNDRDTKDDKDEHRDDELRKTTRGHIRSFVLPPEYDPDDTRWTLKYREHDSEQNLVELFPHSNVFINAIKLAHCKRVSKDSKALARNLLVEIFSQAALSVCSWTGARANVFHFSGTNVRPGLDELARMALLSYVKEHALKKKWGEFDSQSVVNTLRSKIQDVRAKHAKSASGSKHRKNNR